MCLENRLSGKEKEDAIAKLPKTFRVWKFCPRGLASQYRSSGEPRLKIGKRTKAKYLPTRRTAVDYFPGFHAFLQYSKARHKYFEPYTVLHKFEARRKDVIEIGKFNGAYFCLKGVVLSYIKPV